AWRSCLADFSGLVATSVLMPRDRRVCAMSWAADQPSSEVNATYTTVGTLRVDSTMFCENIREINRVTPMESPTPGNVRLPLVASESYRPPEQMEPNCSWPTRFVSYTVPV